MIRAEQQGVVFFHNPKAAGSSINRWFLTNIPGSKHIEPQHIHPTNIIHDGWSFCVVRNPWDRWVSWWCYWHDKLGRIDTPFEEYTIRYFSGDYEGLSGGQYSTCYVQNSMAKDVNYVMRFENLIDDFKLVQLKLLCFEPLNHANRNHNRKHYTEYYTSSKLIDLVGEYYREDIEKFGYQYAI